MGTWGAKLYQDDLALDIKEDYIEKLKSGKTNEEALNEILEMYEESIEDEEEGPIFWLVLADTMWKVGRLTKTVKEKAMKEIERGTNLKYWEEEGTKGEYRTRERELQKLKEKLNSPMPEERKLAVKREIETKRKFEWDIGDVYAYRLKSEEAKKAGMYGQYLILRKVQESEFKMPKVSAIVYCQLAKTLPDIKHIESLQYVVTSNVGNVRYNYKVDMFDVTQKALKSELIKIGNILDMKKPYNEYEYENNKNLPYCTYKELEEYILNCISFLGTNEKPKEIEQDLKFISDERIILLMREKYYKEKLKLQTEGDVISYLSKLDTIIIMNKEPITKVNKEEAYIKIEELKKKVREKEGQLILEKLQEKIKNYKYKDRLAEFLEKTKHIEEKK